MHVFERPPPLYRLCNLFAGNKLRLDIQKLINALLGCRSTLNLRGGPTERGYGPGQHKHVHDEFGNITDTHAARHYFLGTHVYDE